MTAPFLTPYKFVYAPWTNFYSKLANLRFERSRKPIDTNTVCMESGTCKGDQSTAVSTSPNKCKDFNKYHKYKVQCMETNNKILMCATILGTHHTCILLNNNNSVPPLSPKQYCRKKEKKTEKGKD